MFPFTAVIYGILAAGAAFLLESLFLAGMSLTISAFIIGACIEEGMKFLFLFQWQRRFLISYPSALPFRLFAFALFGIGFASVEVFLAVPPHIGILLALTSVHTLTSLLLGYALSVKKLPQISLIIGFVLAVLIHTAYNVFTASLQ